MSYNIDKYDTIIDINLNNGIYTFTPDSATGKSWLCKTLKKYKRLGEPVVAFTYEDIQDGQDLNKKVQPNIVLYMLDIYDLYYNKYIDILKELGKKAIVLVDSKKHLIIPYTQIKHCLIKINQNKITHPYELRRR